MRYLLAPLTWGALYAAYETIKHDLDPKQGDSHALLQLGVTEEMLDRFHDTANSSEHGGLEARHGRPDKKPVANPMPLSEGHDLVRHMLTEWIRRKLEPGH
jgi:hypothetical protein